MASSHRPGQVITFYSYKGGTGRSMALANAACVLAQRQSTSKGILMIDWDLEAPGLHRYFRAQFMNRFGHANDQALDDHPGLIDFFWELDTKLQLQNGTRKSLLEEDTAAALLEEIDLRRVILETDIPGLSLLKAGRFGEEYSSRVNTFRWEAFYHQAPLLLRVFAESLAEQYSYVLVDSRTGLTDVSGICTMLLPEKLVVVFTPNRQSLTGILGLVQRATNYRRQSDDLRPLVVFPLASRIEPTENTLRQYWRKGNADENIVGYQSQFEQIFQEVYGLQKCHLDTYFNHALIQHVPPYAYGEKIAVLDERRGESLVLAQRYETFARLLVTARAPWDGAGTLQIGEDGQPELREESPYRALQPFHEANKDLFFGRQEVVEQLRQRLVLQEQPFLVIVGPSGSGKTSLIQAGVIPSLREERPSWAVLVVQPTADPFAALQLQGLVDAEQNLVVAAQQWLQTHPAQERLVLILDQFEALLLNCPAPIRERFLTQIELLLNARLPLSVSVVMRNDLVPFLSQSIPQALRETWWKDENVFSLPTITRGNLNDIVREPAAAVGLAFQDGLIETIVDNAIEIASRTGIRGRAAQSSVLPLLEYTLHRLWQKRSEGFLTHKAYHDLGELTGEMPKLAEQTFAQLSPEEQTLARHILIQLVQVGDTTLVMSDTRQKRFLTDLSPSEELRETTHRVIAKLASARLVVTANEHDKATVEIVHNALLAWPRFQQWRGGGENRLFLSWKQRLQFAVEEWQRTANDKEQGGLLRGALLDEAERWLGKRSSDLSADERRFVEESLALRQDRPFLLWKQRLQFAVEEWQRTANDKEQGGLLRGALLDEAERWLGERSGDLSADERRFVEESLALRQAEEREKVAQQHRELEAAQKLAQEGEKRASEQARSVTRFRRLTSLLAVCVLGATGLAFFANSQRQRAEAQQHLALASQLAARSALARDQDPALLERSVLLAVETMQRLPSLEADQLLRQGTSLLRKSTLSLATEAEATAVAFSPDGTWLATASEDKTARVWDLSTKQDVARVTHEAAVTAVAFSPDGTRLATASKDKTARVWDLSTKQDVARVTHEAAVTAVAFSPDGTRLATASEDKTARVWDLSTKQEVARVTHEAAVWAVAFSPDGTWLATASWDKTARVWDLSTKQEVARVTHEAAVTAVAFSPDGTRLATASWDKTARVWDLSTKQEVARVTHEAAVTAVAFSPDGTRLATASWDETARVWDLSTKQEVARVTHEAAVTAVAFSPDGTWLATASWDKTARVWDLSTKQEVARVTHEAAVWAVAFSPDGTWLATASEDKTARVWDLSTKQEVARVTHEAAVWAVAFSPDGTRLATASWDKTARVWDLSTKQEVARVTHEAAVTAVAFSPDGTRLATASEDKTARLSFWQPEDMIAEACARLNRNLTRAEWQQYLGDEPYHKTCVNLSIDPTFFEEGRKLAREGKLEEARAIFRDARSLDPSLTLDPDSEARKFAALGLIEKGEKLAREGQVQEAIAAFREALSLDPSLPLDPDSEARKLAAPGLIKEGITLAKKGKVQEARAKYAEAQQFDPTLKISAKDWNELCWAGSLWEHGTEVMAACQQAVDLDSENGIHYDSRGLARALTGNAKGAIEDFTVFIEWIKKERKHKDSRPQREKWIADLKAGKNPFDAETLKALRNQ